MSVQSTEDSSIRSTHGSAVTYVMQLIYTITTCKNRSVMLELLLDVRAVRKPDKHPQIFEQFNDLVVGSRSC